MLLTVSHIAKAYGVDEVLSDVTFRLDAREKVALVGRNGCGKTTLLRIVTGQAPPDRGGVQLARGAKVGYLRQEMPVTFGRSVIEEAEAAVERQLEMRARLAELEAKMEASASPEDVEEFTLLHEHFLEAEGYSAETDVRTVLLKMGFAEDEFARPTDSLSGGERTRLALARLLLEEPDLLILDEPTNHLDLQATEWLEGWLRQYHGAVLLVSHDRTFLENTAERVLEMRDGSVKAYPGPFATYLELRAAEEARQAEVARRQEAEIAKMDEFVRRFMNSQRTAQARGRLKLMNRLVENKVSAPKAERGMKAGFRDVRRGGDIAVSAERLTVGYADKEQPDGELVLFRDLDWVVRFGERWGVIGENGSGKSSLSRVILGQLDPLSGRARLGTGVDVGFFSQDAGDLDPEDSPLDMMVWDLDLKPPEARNLLGRFLITGDDVFRPIKTLSGGEKNKLSLARLTQLNPNLLILDEPTNHLDMASREALGEILEEYKGTLILISHDRRLLSQVTDHTLDIKRSGPVQYPGSYAEYRGRPALRPSRTSNLKSQTSAKPQSSKGKTEAEPLPELSPREQSKEIGRMEKLVSQIEADVADREAELADIEDRLANVDPTSDVYALTLLHGRVKEALAGTMAAWEEHASRLEKLVAARDKRP